MLLCIFPGGGQFYTERYVPGVLIGAAEITLGYYAYKYHKDGDTSRRNSMLWWGLFVFGYSLADAYVGAKMHGFDVQTDLDKVSLSYHTKW
jgi:heme A synthase